MNNKEQGPVYDIPNNDIGRKALLSGLISAANAFCIWGAFNIAQVNPEIGSYAKLAVAGLHLLEIVATGYRFRNDLNASDYPLPEGAVMAKGWRERLAIRNLVFNVLPLFVSLATLSALYAGNSTPTPPPIPGGEIQV